MSGGKLYNKYVSKRDHSGSPEDEYAQNLETIYCYIFERLYPILERAEELNKKLSIEYPEEVMLDEIDESMIKLV